MGLVHDPPNLSVPQNFDSPDGFMEDDGFNGPYKKDGPDGKGRSFQGSWKKEFPWLYYDKTKDRSFCRWCNWGLQKEKLLPEFLRLRYTYEKQRLIGVGWKDYRKGREDLRKHENSEIHKHALEVYIIAATSDSMSKLIDFKAQQQRLKKRAALDTIFAGLKWLGQRGLAIRGHEHDEGNFKSLMEFVSNYHPNLKEHVEIEIRTKHMGWEIQNEILKMLSDGATRKLIKQVQDAKQFAIIIDEVCDKGWVEQLSICLRWVDKEYEVQEKWMTFIALDKSDAEMIYTMVKQSLLAYGLTFDNCRSQASNGASVMRGRKNGVSTRILRDYPLAIYIYCSGHGLSLICQDAVSSHPDLKKTQEYIRSILAFIQYSPRRRIEFKALVVDQAEEEILLAEEEGRPAVPQPKGNLRPLCVTRWVLRAPAMDAFCTNYSKILDYMIEIQDGTLNGTSSKNKDIAVGYVKTLHKFKTYFCARLLQRLYNIVGPVNAEIQGRKCSFGGVRDKIMDLMGVMAAMGSDEQGLAFYEEVKSQAMDIRLEQPMVSRTQHLARWVVRGVRSELGIEQGAIDKFHAKIYATIFEATADGIAQRYPTEDLKLLVQLEEVICDSTSEFVGIICERYSSDLNGITPEVLRSHIKGTHEVIKQKLNDHTKTTFSTEECRVILKENDVLKAACTGMDVLVREYFTLPATSCEAERSFSALRIIKTWLRTSMTHGRMNHCATLKINSDYVEMLDMREVVNEFVEKNSFRIMTYAKTLK